jgi:hypothetical protein
MAKGKKQEKASHIVKGQKGEVKDAAPKGRVGHIVKKGGGKKGCC